jgi:hypothetical protein
MLSTKKILSPRLIGALSLLALLQLQGCDSFFQPVKEPPPIPTVTAADSGAGVVLEPTQELIVRLSVEAQSLGDWSLEQLQPELFKVVGPTFEHVSRGMTGDVYTTVAIWRFVPSTPGTMTLSFGLRRPHGLGAPLQTASFTVTVK